MTPQQFIERWQGNELTEKAGAQAHFDDLCDLLGVAKPRKPGEYQFEYGAKKSSGGDGWADVWKRGCFGWENKKPGRDLKAALKQLTDYAPYLESPPLLVVCDRERIEIHTAFNGYPHEVTTILLQDIGRLENLQTLRWVFTEPERLRPKKSTTAITNAAAGKFADLAEAMNSRDLDPKRVAHFLIQCLFCMYAEDEGLLPGTVLTHLLKHAGDKPEFAHKKLGNLFNAMQQGGEYGDYDIEHFNGGLFATVDIPPLEKFDLSALAVAAAEMDWRFIEPAIFGTLFERGLNPAKRSQLGAHFTDLDTILLLIEPVITRPLKAEWETAKVEIAAIMDKRANTKGKGERTKKYQEAENRFKAYLEKLKNFRVLDPACGSGNFLYLALKTLKDLEKQANTDAEILGLQRQIGIEVSPANVLGLEIEPYAAELARVTIWIGEIQWMRKNGYELNRNPILKPLDTIENRDALISPLPLAGEGSGERVEEATWPKADVIVGNPPFLGGSKIRAELGEAYQKQLWGTFKDRVPGGADLVCYWFDKARVHLQAGKAQRAGLVATNSIRGGANRVVLERILSATIQQETNLGGQHGDSDFRHTGIDRCIEKSGNSTRASRGDSTGVSQSAGSIGDQNRLGLGTSPVANRLGGVEMDDGPIAGGGGFAGIENLLLTEISWGEHVNDNLRHTQIHSPTGNLGVHPRASVGNGECVQGGIGRGGFGNAAGLAGVEPAHSGHDQRYQVRLGEMDSGDAAGASGLGGGTGEATVDISIFNAWADRPWINEGAAVRVSLICFAGKNDGLPVMLDGEPVNEIYADLTGFGNELGNADLTQAKKLQVNLGISFQGTSKKASFDIPGKLAREWLNLPNPNLRQNSDVVRPWVNGLALSGRTSDLWIIDFGVSIMEDEAELYETPFNYALENIKPERIRNNRDAYRKYWWRHAEPRPGMRIALNKLPRFIATIAHSKYRFFVWLDITICPDQALIVFARSDNTTFGVLHSRFHEIWALRMGTSLEDRPRYTPTTTFETFPFPEGILHPCPIQEIPPNPPLIKGGDASPCLEKEWGANPPLIKGGDCSTTLEKEKRTNPPLQKGGRGDFDPDSHFPAIAEAAKNLNQLRENWLNPPQWVDWVQAEEEIKAGFPKRPVAKPGHAAELKQRTLTKLYNQRPAWLDHAQKSLDKAVALAYGWTDYTPEWTDEEILRRLLALNLERST